MNPAFSLFLIILLTILQTTCLRDKNPDTSERPRIIAMPDFGADPDDDQSLVRLLVSSNEFEIGGLINVTSCWRTSQTSTDAFDPFMDAYEQVYPNLVRHADGYPTVEHLRSVIRLGQQDYGMGDVGEGKDSPGSELIIEVVDKPDPRPVWVLLWGGGNTLAQAIWKVRETRTPEEFSEFLSKIRVYDILGQCDAGAWMAKNFPGLFYIRARNQVYGWQLGRDRDNEWLRENIQPRGPLGAVYPDVKWSLEGDTPSFLHVFPNGLNDPEKVDHGGWGGRFSTEKRAGVRGMTESNILDNEADYDPYYMYSDAPEGGAAIRRWREAIQNDFLARMIWSITDNYSDANHHPVAVVNGDQTRQIIEKSATAGTSVTLDATGSSDPDGDKLFYNWFFYKEPGSYYGSVSILNSESAVAEVLVPSDAAGSTIHIILELSDDGEPGLTAYRRIIVKVLN
jgi:hypothetical protein